LVVENSEGLAMKLNQEVASRRRRKLL